MPSIKISVNGLPVETTIEQENGKWFWLTAPLQGGENEIQFELLFKEKSDK